MLAYAADRKASRNCVTCCFEDTKAHILGVIMCDGQGIISGRRLKKEVISLVSVSCSYTHTPVSSETLSDVLHGLSDNILSPLCPAFSFDDSELSSAFWCWIIDRGVEGNT